ncbi:TPA: hypothetical protein N0F65_007026 [Lagenidium giganteum]|uniref:EF-hand domain-containing protein n=1 Tax=Lagenidium giganteum TaxID=4803 RepID=A0AAV2YU32_9STRA|nr:TPA: hypothetical protein N0F65_007026 [Lagenidium giganteum]
MLTLPMESTRNYDVPRVLTPELEKKLLRVFCFLRQHDRKNKIFKKKAEIRALRGKTSMVLAEQVALVKELEDLSSPLGTPEIEDNLSVNRQLAELAEEVKELQKGIAFKDGETGGGISTGDLHSLMKSMGVNMSKVTQGLVCNIDAEQYSRNCLSCLQSELQWMIWEVDEDLDGIVTWEEFKASCARCLADKHNLEPNQLFHLVQFLMCDADNSQSVSVAELTDELRKLSGTDYILSKILHEFGSDTDEEQAHKFSLADYLKVIVMGAGIVSRAFVQAYQQAVHNAKTGNTAAMTAKSVVKKSGMPREQALEILNFPTTGKPSSEEILRQYTRYFEVNDPAKGGSFYLQSKIFRAKEALEKDMASEQSENAEKPSQ